MSRIERFFPATGAFGGLPQLDAQRPWDEPAGWPVGWLHAPAGMTPAGTPALLGFRCRFALHRPIVFQMHVTADEQYRLFLDGDLAGAGPEAGDRANWFYESFRVELPAGEHVLALEVEAFGERRAASRASVRPGMLCAAEGLDAPAELCGGAMVAHAGEDSFGWQVARLAGVEFPPLADESLASAQWADMTGPGYAFDRSRYRPDWWNDDGLAWVEPARGAGGNGGMRLYPSAPVPLLRPALLPPARELEHRIWRVCCVRSALHSNAAGGNTPDASHWQALLQDGEALTIPSDTSCEVVLDSGDYLCAFSELHTAGGRGAMLSLAWSEALRTSDGQKTRPLWRNAQDASTPIVGSDPIVGCGQNIGCGLNSEGVDEGGWLAGAFAGVRDRVRLNGGTTRLRMPQWRAGRFLHVRVRTQQEPLRLERLRVLNSVYGPAPRNLMLEDTIRPPAGNEPTSLAEPNDGTPFATDDASFDRLLRACLRTARACRRDVFMDCPHYEQLQYVGDTRLQILLSYLLDPDHRPARRALELIAASGQNPTRLPLGCYPGKGGGLLPPFALWLAPMVRDYALWRDDAATVRRLLPCLRGVLDWFLQLLDPCGLVRSPFGWNFLDAALGQIVPGGEPGKISGPLNWQLALALRDTADLEQTFGEPECAARFRRHAAALSAAADRLLLRPDGVFADTPDWRDDPNGATPSEHGQILALLGGTLGYERQNSLRNALAGGVPMRPTGGYFTHYLFEVFRDMGRADLLFARLDPWRWALAAGFLTFPEHFSPSTRSDCHAWNAHPLYHFYATLLGIRPLGWGFRRVRIAPLPGPLTCLRGVVRHPRGALSADLRRDADGSWRATVTLPPNVSGEMVWNNKTHPLSPGSQVLRLPALERAVTSCSKERLMIRSS